MKALVLTIITLSLCASYAFAQAIPAEARKFLADVDQLPPKSMDRYAKAISAGSKCVVTAAYQLAEKTQSRSLTEYLATKKMSVDAVASRITAACDNVLQKDFSKDSEVWQATKIHYLDLMTPVILKRILKLESSTTKRMG